MSSLTGQKIKDSYLKFVHTDTTNTGLGSREKIYLGNGFDYTISKGTSTLGTLTLSGIGSDNIEAGNVGDYGKVENSSVALDGSAFASCGNSYSVLSSVATTNPNTSKALVVAATMGVLPKIKNELDGFTRHTPAYTSMYQFHFSSTSSFGGAYSGLSIGSGATDLADPNSNALLVGSSIDSNQAYIRFATRIPMGVTSGALTAGFSYKGISGYEALLPNGDNNIMLGNAAYRWSEVYAATGTINTSDERLKTFSDIPKAEMQVAKELKTLVRRFKFNDAIEKKGIDNARIHYGTSAQEVIAVFEKYGLDAMRYAMVCYDEWDTEYETKVLKEAVVDKEGNVLEEAETEQVLVRAAGNRYGIRYEELIMFILGGM